MTPVLSNLDVLLLCCLFGGSGALMVGCLWGAAESAAGVRLRLGIDALDETSICEKCGCGMVTCARGWQCPECKHLVEGE